MKSDWLLKAPLTVNWTLNTSCTFACRHCYSRAEREEPLDGATLAACFAKVAKAGVMAVNFGGGEPLLRPDLCELAAAASRLGLRVSLNSNGFLLDSACALALKAAGVASVGVSIDSHEASVHDDFRGVAGSHEHACRAVAALNAAGIRTSLSTVVCTINHEKADELIAFARRLGVAQLNFHNFKCAGLGLANRDELDLSPLQWREFYARALAVGAGEGPEITFDDPIIASLGGRGEGGGLVKGSVCGKLSLAIKANGDITPCGFIPAVIGNIVRDDLGEVWRTSPVLHALRHKTATGKCAGCGHYAECLGGCSARALAVAGDVNAPDPHCWVE